MLRLVLEHHRWWIRRVLLVLGLIPCFFFARVWWFEIQSSKDPYHKWGEAGQSKNFRKLDPEKAGGLGETALLSFIDPGEKLEDYESDWIGFSLALSGDWLAVGAPIDSRKRPNQGSVYIFKKAKGAVPPWEKVTRLSPEENTESQQWGQALAMLDDTLVIGAPLANTTGKGMVHSGRVEIYRRSRDEWRLEQSIDAPPLLPDAATDHPQWVGNRFFGWSLTVWENWLAVGAKDEPSNHAPVAGVVRLFKRDGPNKPYQLAQIIASPIVPLTMNRFGKSIDMKAGILSVVAPSEFYLEGSKIGSNTFTYRLNRKTNTWEPGGELPSKVLSLRAATSVSPRGEVAVTYGRRIALFQRANHSWPEPSIITCESRTIQPHLTNWSLLTINHHPFSSPEKSSLIPCAFWHPRDAQGSIRPERLLLCPNHGQPPRYSHDFQYGAAVEDEDGILVGAHWYPVPFNDSGTVLFYSRVDLEKAWEKKQGTQRTNELGKASLF